MDCRRNYSFFNFGPRPADIPGTKKMKTNITFDEISNELFNILSDDRKAVAYMADSFGPQYIGLCGWAGPMSPANRAAFVSEFGHEMTDRAEDQARARVTEYRAAVDSSTYHAAELDADAWQAVYGDSEKSQHQEPPEGLTLADIPGGVAVVGDSRTTYRHRRDIKARGAKWNKAAQQWEATDPEAIANLHEWLAAPESAPAPADDAPSTMVEETAAPAPELPAPPAAVVYDPAQPVEAAEFHAVDEQGRPYGDAEKSQNPEAYSDALADLIAKHVQTKQKYPEAVVLFRKDDFYMSYFADAHTVAGTLELAESTDGGAPVAAFNFYDLDKFLPKLIRAGLCVCIVDHPGYNVPFPPKYKDPITAESLDGSGYTAYVNCEKSQNPEVQEYRLMYLFGAWITKERIYAETDEEAIHDADEVYKEAKSLHEWRYRVALMQGDRVVKEYPCGR